MSTWMIEANIGVIHLGLEDYVWISSIHGEQQLGSLLKLIIII